MASLFQSKARELITGEDKIIRITLNDLKVGLFLHQGKYSLPIELSIRLSPGAVHGGALPSIQHAKLNTGLISRQPHQTIKCINLAHKMALPQATNRGIAGHCSNRPRRMGDQSRFCTHPGACCSGFAARMAPTNNHHIKGINH